MRFSATARLMLFSTTVSLFLSGCAVELTRGAEQVRLINGGEKAGCARIKTVTTSQRTGPDKPGNAMKLALNETAAVGGNAFNVVSTSGDFDGASVIGEAMKCS